jgi:hypothetical protein
MFSIQNYVACKLHGIVLLILHHLVHCEIPLVCVKCDENRPLTCSNL